MIAPSFADIFFNNCFKNGVLPIALPQEQVDILAREASQAQDPTFTVDLDKQEIRRPIGNEVFTFEVDPFRKHCLLNGLDDVGLTMQKSRQDRRLRGRPARRRSPGSIARSRDGVLRNDPAPLGAVLLLPGDGIGPEVMARGAARDGLVREAPGHQLRDRGGAGRRLRIDRHGTPLTDAAMAKAMTADAVLFGAVGGPK